MSKNTPTLRDQARKAAMSVRRGKKLTGEDLRLRCESQNVFANTPNQWGGVVQSLINEGVLTKTEEFVPMRDPRSHGRSTRVYVRS